MSSQFPTPALQVHGAPTEGAVLIAPVPASVPMPELRMRGMTPSAVYLYRTAAKALVAIVVRYDMPDGKRFCPVTLWRALNGTVAWHSKGLGDNRPLYRLPELVAAPGKTVLLVEGEKCADAVAGFQTMVGTTWMGGAKALERTDFSPLKGRDVLIMPDLDQPGAEAAKRLVTILREVGVGAVRIVDTGKFAAEFGAADAAGYDIADAIEQGMTEQKFNELLSRAGWTETVLGQSDPFLREIACRFGWSPNLPADMSLGRDGIYKQDIDRHGRLKELFVSSAFVVLGRTRTGSAGAGWGYMLALISPDGAWVTTVVPSRLLAGDGREFRETLGALGVTLPQSRAGRQALSELIAFAKQDRIIDVTSRTGWYGDAFALPHMVIQAPGGSEVMIDLGGRSHKFGQAGRLQKWEDLAGLAEGNSRAAFALCVALSGPLLRPLGLGGGGFHFFGQSSRGKTTLLILAGSVWGGGGKDGFCRSWRASSNGPEAMIVDHNDILLPLDESTLMTPETALELPYLLANGIGKSRANVDGTARATAEWVVPVLSSGELSFDHIISGAKPGKKTVSGHTVRMIDLPIEHSPGESFETLHGRANSKVLAEEIASLARNNYGFAGPAFVQALVEERATLVAEASRIVAAVTAELQQEGDDPQVGRVCTQFAVAAAAGTLATRLGILPWQEGSALAAVKACHAAWKAQRGTNVSDEVQKAEMALREFFDLHGSTRFESITDVRTEDEVPNREAQNGAYNRCGYRRHDPELGTIYYVLPGPWRTQICAGHNADLMARVAQSHGALEPGEGGRPQKKVRLPDYPNGTRVYVIRAALLP